jgi:hypothetical protein
MLLYKTKQKKSPHLQTFHNFFSFLFRCSRDEDEDDETFIYSKFVLNEFNEETRMNF